MICHGCGGVVGRDCFNPQECELITQSMAYELNNTRSYEVDFDGHVKFKVHVRGNELFIEAAMNGYGDAINWEIKEITGGEVDSILDAMQK